MDGGRLILLVDDDLSLLGYAHRYLVRLGYEVLMARSPEEATAALADHDVPFSLAIIDVTVGGGLASNFGRLMQQQDPDLPILYWSGYSIPEEQLREGHAGRVGFLTKPFRPRQFKELIEQLVRRS